MQIAVAGKHIAIGVSLKEYVEERAKDIVTKYFENAISMNVHFTKQGFEFICDILMNEGTGRHMPIRSSASSDEIYSSFDIAISKLEKQLRRYKSKLNDRHNRTKLSESPTLATKYVISPYQMNDEDNSNDQDNPVIIAEKPVAIMTLSVKEAVMHMDLANVPALMFQNSKTGRTNIIYYRRDGNISWVDSN